MRTKGCLRHTPKSLAGLRTHRQHRLHEKSPSAFVAALSHAADLAPMGKVDVGGIWHQQHHGGGRGLFPAVVQVRLHQGRKGDIWLVKPTIPGFGLFPWVHLSGQRTQGVLRQVGGRFDRSSRSTPSMQLDTPTGSLGPALGIQHVLCVHPLLYHFVNCG